MSMQHGITQRRSPGRKGLYATAAIGLAFVTFAGASPAQAAAACTPSNIWVNSAGAGATLQEFSVDPETGALSPESSAPLDGDYGDIAISPDEHTMYGVLFGTLNRIDSLDMGSGGSTPSTVPTPLFPAFYLNSLSFTDDGRLFTSSSAVKEMYVIDPVSGAWERPIFSEFPKLSEPDEIGLYAAGDFLTLPDGDVLAVLTNLSEAPGWAFLARIDVNGGAPEVVAKVNHTVYGAAQSGNRIYLASPDGNIYSLDGVPQSGSVDTDITSELDVAWDGGGDFLWWGATSAQDAGGCEVPVVPVDPANPANPVSIEPTAPARIDTGIPGL